MTTQQFCIWLDGYIQSHNNVNEHHEYDYDFKIDIIQKFKEVDLYEELNSNHSHEKYNELWWNEIMANEFNSWMK